MGTRDCNGWWGGWIFLKYRIAATTVRDGGFMPSEGDFSRGEDYVCYLRFVTQATNTSHLSTSSSLAISSKPHPPPPRPMALRNPPLHTVLRSHHSSTPRCHIAQPQLQKPERADLPTDTYEAIPLGINGINRTRTGMRTMPPSSSLSSTRITDMDGTHGISEGFI
ncbi:hypothetical protein L873DRAFT_619141 [Choiromyces venosus 120613-1]|uniref:Uncharacterized protein n=1 Tax=Choiromyces venosus 120613-1 TaxID=1336337 RepID=A0A3N4IUJ3_9PEZI|nr:hypothetical protein L873DRAFT_619141 [Choiromyces venosus 120613-1]